MEFKAGDVFYLRKGIPGDPLYKCHVVGIVEGQVIYRWYGKRKQWWHYEIDDPELLEISIKGIERFKEDETNQN